MLDDEIQYLGTRPKPREPPRFPQRSVAGVTLHIEKSDGNDAYLLAFERDKSSTIHIGRRPGSEIESRTLDQEKGRAMFRCAVVSRRHAKIAFSDSGHVYLIDLNSHHGTHIRKPGETSSRMLEPEMPTPLSDGDIITFGKTVGRNEEMVRPVVARVQLLHSGPSPTIKPLVVPDTTLISRSTSGRYGLHSPLSSSSDEAYNGQSDSYSDIEEIPPPASTAAVPVAQTVSQSKPESHLGRAFEVLKRLLPPTSIPVEPDCEPEPPIIDDPSSAQSSAASSSSPLSELPPFWTLSDNRCSPLSLFPRYPSLSGIDLSDHFFPLPPINPSKSSSTSSPDDDGNHSRSESPMDLASPSPSPAEQTEPHVIGPWSNFSPVSEQEAAASADKLLIALDQYLEEPAAQTREGHEDKEDAAANSTPHPSTTKDKEKEQEMVIDPDMYVTKVVYEELKMKHLRLQEEVSNLQTQRRKYKSKFNSNVHTVTDKFSELEDRVNDMSAQCALFVDQIENVTNVDVPDLQAQIDDLQDQQAMGRVEADDLKRGIVELKNEAKERESVQRAGVSSEGGDQGKMQEYSRMFQALVDEMKMLRTTTKQEITAELESIRLLRQSILNESPVPSSLKRKRSVDDEGQRDTEADNDHEETDRLLKDGDVPMSTNPHLPQAGPFAFGLECPAPERSSPNKRARKLLSAITPIVVGGAATWLALAYS